MGFAAMLPLLDAALMLIEKVSPHIKAAFAKGDITPEQQQALKDRMAKIGSATAFSAPHWQKEP